MSTEPHHIRRRDDADEDESSETSDNIEDASEEVEEPSDVNSTFQQLVDECGERYREALKALS